MGSSSFPSGVNRDALLEQAARLLDERKGHLSGGGGIGESAEGLQVRALKADQAVLPATDVGPAVYEITDADFLKQGVPAPIPLQQLKDRFRFYWIHLPIGLMPAHNWAFNRLEARIEFGPASSAHPRARAFRILPDKKFQTMLEANTELRLGIDENFEFSAAAPGTPIPGAKLGVDVEAAAKLGLVAGPFIYRLRRARIEHNDIGLEWVQWRLDGEEFFQENRPQLVVIAQVPKEAETLTVSAAVQAFRFFNFATADLQHAVKQLPAALRAFFQGGLPTDPDQKEYDLTAAL